MSINLDTLDSFSAATFIFSNNFPLFFTSFAILLAVFISGASIRGDLVIQSLVTMVFTPSTLLTTLQPLFKPATRAASLVASGM